MYPQAPGLSPEYSYKEGLQTVITEKLLQIGPVTRFSVRACYNGPNPTWASRPSEDVGWGDVVVGLCLVVHKAKGGPRRFFCFHWRSEKDKGWSEG
jgi:hypothetical protein